MPIEHASVRVVHKPWGVSDLQPWSSIDGSGDAVGELWFERADKHAPIPALLLKLLFTSEPLSIQVHPDDTFARAMGMPNGKSEAWYILSAKPGAQIGVGLEASDNATGITRIDQGRFDRRTGSMASSRERRRHLHPGRHDPRHRRRHRACRNSAAQRHDIPPVRLWQTARIARRQRRGGCRHRGRFEPHAIRPASPRIGRSLSRAGISSWSGLICPRARAGRCWPNRRPGFSFSMATRAIGLAAASIGQAVFVGGGRTSIEVGSRRIDRPDRLSGEPLQSLPCCSGSVGIDRSCSTGRHGSFRN